MKKITNGEVYLLVYADDIILFTESDEVNDVKCFLAKCLTINDLETCPHFSGMNMEYTPHGSFLYERPFIEKIIPLADMDKSKSADYPLPLAHCLYDSLQDLS